MAEFNAAQALAEAKERHEQAESGAKLVPVAAAIVAVLAALATLFANHNSIGGLSQKNEAVLYQTKASDQYGYYESKRIKAQLNQALLNAGVARDGLARARLSSAVASETAAAKRILAPARQDELSAEQHAMASERSMRSYEAHEVAATLFEVSIVLVSITALMRSKALLWIAAGATAVGLGFFADGFLR